MGWNRAEYGKKLGNPTERGSAESKVRLGFEETNLNVTIFYSVLPTG